MKSRCCVPRRKIVLRNSTRSSSVRRISSRYGCYCIRIIVILVVVRSAIGIYVRCLRHLRDFDRTVRRTFLIGRSGIQQRPNPTLDRVGMICASDGRCPPLPSLRREQRGAARKSNGMDRIKLNTLFVLFLDTFVTKCKLVIQEI